MPNYINLQKLPEESVEALKKLYSEFNPPFATGVRRRIGKSDQARLATADMGDQSLLSVYKDTRWFKWTTEQRKRFRDAIGNEKYTKALVGYFLELPRNKGFIAEMDAWVHMGEGAAVIIAYALKDGQTITIAGEKVIVNTGEGIAFKLSHIHEVKKSKRDALWANTMVLGPLESFA